MSVRSDLNESALAARRRGEIPNGIDLNALVDAAIAAGETADSIAGSWDIYVEAERTRSNSDNPLGPSSPLIDRALEPFNDPFFSSNNASGTTGGTTDGDGDGVGGGDPDFLTAPQAVKDLIAQLATPSAANPTPGTLIDVGNGTFTMRMADGRRETYNYNADGSTIVSSTLLASGTASANDIARSNLVNMQAEQLQALLNGDLIDLGNGRSLVPGTGQVIDMRDAGDFKQIAGTSGAFVDSVTGSVFDDAGNVLARDIFEFESGPQFQEFHDQHADEIEERIRQFNTTTAETQRQFDATFQVQQDQFNAEFTEGARRFDAQFTEGQRRDDNQLSQRKAEFDSTFQEGQRVEDNRLGETQRQFDANFDERQRNTNLDLFQNVSLAGDQNRLGALQAALSGATNQAGINSQNLGTLSRLTATPGQYVEAEAFRRGLEGGELGGGTGFADQGALSGIIEQLRNFAVTQVPPEIMAAINAGASPRDALIEGGLDPELATFIESKDARDAASAPQVTSARDANIEQSDFKRRTGLAELVAADDARRTDPNTVIDPNTGSELNPGMSPEEFFAGITPGQSTQNFLDSMEKSSPDVPINIDSGLTPEQIEAFFAQGPQGSITEQPRPISTSTGPRPINTSTGTVPLSGNVTAPLNPIEGVPITVDPEGQGLFGFHFGTDGRIPQRPQAPQLPQQAAPQAQGALSQAFSNLRQRPGFTTEPQFVTGEPEPGKIGTTGELIQNPTNAPIRVLNNEQTRARLPEQPSSPRPLSSMVAGENVRRGIRGFEGGTESDSTNSLSSLMRIIQQMMQKGGGMRFNPNAQLDTSQIDDRRGDPFELLRQILAQRSPGPEPVGRAPFGAQQIHDRVRGSGPHGTGGIIPSLPGSPIGLFQGTDPLPGTRSNTDEAINNTVGLRFLRGEQGAHEDFNRLGTGTVEGAFGTRIPLAGNFNAIQAQQIQRDPQTFGVLSSIFNSGSIDLQSELNRAIDRGPRGRAQATSTVRT